MEFAVRNFPYLPQVPFSIIHQGKILAAGYRVDFVCFETIIVELKAIARLSTIEEAQTISYLKASKHERALLLNFGT